MMNRKVNEGLCRGRMTQRRNPLWGAYGTYPEQRNGCGHARREGAVCPLTRAEERSRGNGNGCGCSGNSNGHERDRDCGKVYGRDYGYGYQEAHSDCQCHGHHHDHNHGGCECNKLLQQIRAVDFALYEVVLYLDVYPTSCEALETYHKLMARRKALYSDYQATCGPITAMGNESRTAWDWIEKPFPWEASAN